MKKDSQLIEDKQFLQAVHTGLLHFGLRLDNVVTRKEFMENTRSVPVNRYVRLPNRFLAQYDKRVFNKNTIEAIIFDPTKSKEEQANPDSGIKLEENVHFDNAYFHNARYMSAFMTTIDNLTVIKINYNYKLVKLVPRLVDITAFTGMVLTKMYNCSGIYARAGSFSRSEEYFCYVHNGDIKSDEKGTDSCMGYLQPSKISRVHNIDCKNVMEEVDNRISIHYASEDMTELEQIKKKHFSNYGVDRSEIYRKLDKVMDHWRSRSYRRAETIVDLMEQMLIKEADLKGLDGLETDKQKEEERKKIAVELAEIVIARDSLKQNLYNESYVRDVCFNVDFIPRQ